MAELTCERCGETRQGLEKAPFRNEMGERIQKNICAECWQQWLNYQTALINHYGLDVRDREARDFLMQNVEAFLFSTGETEDIDTSQEGNINW